MGYSLKKEVKVQQENPLPTQEEFSENESNEKMDYFYGFFMCNPIDNYFKDKFQNHTQAEMDRRDYQKLYLKVWKQEYDSIMNIIKKKCESDEDITRYKTFINEVNSSYNLLQPLLLAEMLDNYAEPEAPEKYSYGNGTQPMLDMYQGMIYRNACMLFIPYLQDEYSFPSEKELNNRYILSQSDNQQVVSDEPIATEDIIDNGEESNLAAELEPEIGEFSLSDDTKKFVFGKWRVKKLLGFYRSWNDASEYPNGQDIIGNKLIIQSDFFSSLGLKKYKDYQSSFKNPYYCVKEIYYDADSLYRVRKLIIPELADNDKVQVINVALNSKEYHEPMAFICINNERLIFSLEATIFELEKIEA